MQRITDDSGEIAGQSSSQTGAQIKDAAIIKCPLIEGQRLTTLDATNIRAADDEENYRTTASSSGRIAQSLKTTVIAAQEDTPALPKRIFSWCLSAWKDEKFSMAAHVPSAIGSTLLCGLQALLVEGAFGSGSGGKSLEAVISTVSSQLFYFSIFIPLVMVKERKSFKNPDDSFSKEAFKRKFLELRVMAASMIMTSEVPNIFYMFGAQTALQVSGMKMIPALFIAQLSSDALYTFIVPLYKKAAPAITDKYLDLKTRIKSWSGGKRD